MAGIGVRDPVRSNATYPRVLAQLLLEAPMPTDISAAVGPPAELLHTSRALRLPAVPVYDVQKGGTALRKTRQGAAAAALGPGCYHIWGPGPNEFNMDWTKYGP